MLPCRHAPLVLAPDVLVELARRYAEPQRAYHTAAHVAEVLQWFDELADAQLWRTPAEVYLAIVFHDAVYDPRAKSGANERDSAELARTLAGANDRVVELILATARHGSIDPSVAATDPDLAHFLDADTAILGAEPARFDRYDEQIRFEYGHVPDDAYRLGRGGFLRSMLARERIYLTEYFHGRLDAAARANLGRALARLGV